MATLRLYPAEDTHISQVQPAQGFGAYPYLYAGIGSRASYARQALLRFDLAPYQGADIASAKLYVYSEKDDQTWNSGVLYCGVANNGDWSGASTWNNLSVAPKSDPAPVSRRFAGYGQYFAFDVTAQARYLLLNGNPGFLLYAGANATCKRIPSKEAGQNRPYLQLEYTPGDSGAPSGGGSLQLVAQGGLRSVSSLRVRADGALRSALLQGVVVDGRLRGVSNRRVTIAATKAARVRSNDPGNNYSNTENLLVGYTGKNGTVSQVERTLLYFDFPEELKSATITSALLQMQQWYEVYQGSSALHMNVRKVTRAWERSSVTWNAVKDACVRLNEDFVAVENITGEQGSVAREFDITAAIAACVGAADYHGIALMDVSESSEVPNRKNFKGPTADGGVYTPKLVVTYE